MPRLATLLAIVVATGSTVLAPPAAHAERLEVVDRAGDVQRLDWQQSTKNHPVFLAAPVETSVDIVRTVVVHRPNMLTMKIRFRDVVRLTDHETWVRVMTPANDRYDVQITARPRGRVNVVVTRNDRAFSCAGMRAGLRAGLEGSPDRVELSLPTGCLGVPAWVRVGAMAEGFEDTPSPDQPYNFEMYVDDAQRHDVGEGVAPALSPRVSRG